MTLPACEHYDTQDGVCGDLSIARYLPGWRCTDHTPARLLGRPETVPDPDATLEGIRKAAGVDPDAPITPAGDTVVDQRARESGKRRSSPQDHRASQRHRRGDSEPANPPW